MSRRFTLPFVRPLGRLCNRLAICATVHDALHDEAAILRAVELRDPACLRSVRKDACGEHDVGQRMHVETVQTTTKAAGGRAISW